MKLVIFLFLMLMTCSTLFAYQVNVTKLTNEKFDPLPEEIDAYYCGYFEEYEKSSHYYKDTQIATITLVFKPNEIGKDYDAVVKLAEKEAAKLGADLVYYVSSTIYKDTEDIGATTFRCSRYVNWLLIDSDLRPKQYTKNKFAIQKDGKVIYDKATGLMWQQSGSEKYVTYFEALNYIRQLNRESFAGYNDWRLPTLKEATTLLKPERATNNLFIDPLFEDKQELIWTSDLSPSSRAWVVHFYANSCYNDALDLGCYVRAVR